jgi:hypothetical protein
MLHLEKKSRQEEATIVISSTKVTHVPYRNHEASCEKLIPKPAPNGTKIYHTMLVPFHDSMPSFMNFRQVLDLREFKNKDSQCLLLS